MTQQDLMKMVRNVSASADPLSLIEKYMAEAVSKEIGGDANVTFCRRDEVSVMVYQPEHMDKAAAIMKQAGLTEIERAWWSEDDENYGCIYCKL